MDWLAPVAGLVGVIVGGFLTAALTAELDRRRELVAATVAARFVIDELKLTRDTVEEALRTGRWGAILDPGLPYAHGLWAVEHRGGHREPSAWVTHAAQLGRCLGSEELDAVFEPYRLTQRMSLRFWTDDPNRAIGEEQRDYLHTLIVSIEPAILALKPWAEGARKTRVQRIVVGR